MRTSQALLATTALLATLATVGTAAAADPVTIGIAVNNLQSDFPNQIIHAAQDEGKKRGVNVIVVDASNDSSRQVSQIQDLITQKVNALVYIPAGATAAGVPVRAAHAAGIPVINVDRNAPDSPGDSFIATNSVAAAHTLGEYVIKESGGKGKVAIIQGQLGTTPEVDRQKGFGEALASAPDLKVVAQQASKAWMQDEGFAIAQDMLQRDPDINVVFGQADALALGAAQAAKVANLDHKVIVVGFDGDAAGLKAVKDGTLNATMTQQTRKMGRLAIGSALDLIEKKPVEKEQLLGAELTTKANVDGMIADHP